MKRLLIALLPIIYAVLIWVQSSYSQGTILRFFKEVIPW
ncbi:hypothetical protein SAMN05216244_2042 [Sediminibacillus halophilus]|uniref:Uncharacterized protein n=1 Tax=Sediminibacillus halophilus TaxID=482461 RepID=A0A1G9RML4_9BACI|nr:hypothetical protein SAMN05216244_2042 [Sediminibacillus halophilus]